MYVQVVKTTFGLFMPTKQKKYDTHVYVHNYVWKM